MANAGPDQTVADANNATYIRPEGFPQDPKPYQVNDRTDPEKHADLGWLAMTYELSGSRYNVEYMESASQPKKFRYSERPYGRFGAFYETELTEEKPIELQYRVVISEGKSPAGSEIQQRFEAFQKETAAR